MYFNGTSGMQIMLPIRCSIQTINQFYYSFTDLIGLHFHLGALWVIFLSVCMTSNCNPRRRYRSS